MRAKLPALREALEGRVHAAWIDAILAHVNFLDRQIADLTETIGEQVAPFETAVELLGWIPGVQRRNAEAIGADRRRDRRDLALLITEEAGRLHRAFPAGLPVR